MTRNLPRLIVVAVAVSTTLVVPGLAAASGQRRRLLRGRGPVPGRWREG
jgi:hypothetical protein